MKAPLVIMTPNNDEAEILEYDDQKRQLKYAIQKTFWDSGNMLSDEHVIIKEYQAVRPILVISEDRRSSSSGWKTVLTVPMPTSGTLRQIRYQHTPEEASRTISYKAC